MSKLGTITLSIPSSNKQIETNVSARKKNKISDEYGYNS